MASVPQPKKNAVEVVEITMAIVGAVVPPIAVIKPWIDAHQKFKAERAQKILISEIEEHGISMIDDDQYEFYVPAVYRFLEQVRLGEYEHNLRVLAALIAQGLANKPNRPDVGIIGRAARKLELISNGELETLAASKVALDQILDNGPSLSSEYHFDHKGLLDTHERMAMPVSLEDLVDRLHELNVRGLLRYSPPSGFFHGGYSFTRAGREIIDAVAQKVSSAGTRS